MKKYQYLYYAFAWLGPLGFVIAALSLKKIGYISLMPNCFLQFEGMTCVGVEAERKVIANS
jgi:hypothetical protein